MFLKYRPARLDDLEECLPWVREHFAYDAAGRCDLLAFWRHGLRSGQSQMQVMEDLDAAPGGRIYYFVFRVFVSDEFARRLRADTPPLLGPHIVDLWRCGRSPLLTLDEVRAVNSGRRGEGLNFVAAHVGGPAFITGVGLAELGRNISEWVPYSTSGYRLREYWLEMYGETDWAWAEGIGLHLMRDYARERADGPLPRVPPGKQPRLYGIGVRDAMADWGKVSALLFRWQPPRFYFTPAEQELLLYALTGDTEEDLAAQLHIARISIKKRWQTIYGRVEDAAPELFASADHAADSKRGTEKRRYLLSYLQHHMEELRPLLPPTLGPARSAGT